MLNAAIDNPPDRRDWVVALAIGLLMLALIGGLHAARGTVGRIDVDLLHGLRAALFPRSDSHTDHPVAIVAIDESTFRTPPFDKIPKTMMTPHLAAVQAAVLDGGAAVVGWDIVQSTLIGEVTEELAGYDAPLLQSLAVHGRAQGRVVLGSTNSGGETVMPHPAYTLTVGPGNVAPLSIGKDGDGVSRSVRLYDTILAPDGSPANLPGMAAELASRLGAAIPPADELIVNFPDTPGVIPIYSFADLWACAGRDDTDAAGYFRDQFADRAVLIGLVFDREDRKAASSRFTGPLDTVAGFGPTCTGAKLFRHEATGGSVPGVLIHAAAVSNLVRGDSLTYVPGWVIVGGGGMIAFLAALGAVALRPREAILLALLLGGGWLIASLAAFDASMVFPFAHPITGEAAALALGTAWRRLTVDRDRRRIREAFGRYVDNDLIDALMAGGKMPTLDGEFREMSCLFLDIQKFTAMTDRLGPEQMVRVLNQLFDMVDDCVRPNGGVIERFHGDMVVAVFGAPAVDADHAFHAAAATVGIVDGLPRLPINAELPDDLPLRVRIGVNSGKMTVGNVGARTRFTYTMMGNEANLAARLEALCKWFDTPSLAGENTAGAASDRILFRRIAPVTGLGVDFAIDIFEPIGFHDAVSAERRAEVERYTQALARIEAGETEAGLADLANCADAGDAVAGRVHRYLTLQGAAGDPVGLPIHIGIKATPP